MRYTLEVTSTLPAGGASAVETGATVQVTFGREIDPASLTTETLLVRAGGVALPSAIEYDASTRTARAAVPLLPDGTYDVEVTTEVRTLDGISLGAAEQWTFTTRPWQETTVDATGDVGTYTSIAVDGEARLHMTYADQGDATLEYATCAASCATGANWESVAVDGTAGWDTSVAADDDRAFT